MSLWQRILQGLTAFSTDTIISNLAAVLSAALVFRYLDVSAYGQLTLALSLYAGVAVLLDLGLSNVFVAEVARARGAGNLGRARFLMTRYLWLNVATGCLMLGISLAIGYARRSPLWAVMGLYLLTTALTGVISVLFHSHTRYRSLAAQSIVQSLARLLLLAALPLWWRGELLHGVAWTYPLMDVAALAMSLCLARRVWRTWQDVPSGGYALALLTSLLRQRGIYAMLTVPVKKIGDQMPFWFLKVLVGDAGVGLYGAAQKGFALLYAFFNALENTIFPLVSEQLSLEKERLQIALRQMQKYTFWLGLAAAVGGGLLAPWLIRIVAGPRYLAAVPLFRLMLWNLVLYAFMQPQRPLFYALGQQRWLFVLYLFNVLVYALALPVGIAVWGVIGAVGATLFYAFLTAGTRMAVLGRLDSHLLLDPRGVFKIEGFDRRLWEMVQATVRRWLQP